MNDPAMGAGIWLDTVLRRLRHTAGDRAARLRGAAAMRDHYSPIGYGTPMPDIVERLRKAYPPLAGYQRHVGEEAADEIERLREHIAALQLVATAHDAEIERLRAALQSLTVDPPPTLDEPDTDAEVVIKMREIARRALEPKP